jgi:TPR repeat protein
MWPPKFFRRGALWSAALVLSLVSGLLLIDLPAAADFAAGMQAANRHDYAGALRAWRPLAEAGDARAQHHIGDLYEEGRGIGRDLEEAAIWYRRAAEQGYGRAQNALAILYVEGRGVDRDPVEAYGWFALAAGAGNGFAGRNLERLKGMLTEDEIAEGERRADAFEAVRR